jgi:hypothetical protein
MKITCKRINQALIDAGFEGVELVRGDGYCYFWPYDSHPSHWLDKCMAFGGTTSVMVPRLSDLTVEQWVEELRSLHNKFIGAV